MQTHNSERQAALKRKRDVAEEEVRAKAQKETRDIEARAPKKPRIHTTKRPRSDDEEETRASKKPRVQTDEVEITLVRPKKDSKRAKPDAARQNGARDQKKRPRPEEEEETRAPKRKRVQSGEADIPLANLGKKSKRAKSQAAPRDQSEQPEPIKKAKAPKKQRAHSGEADISLANAGKKSKRTKSRAAPRDQSERPEPTEEATQLEHTRDTNEEGQLIDRPKNLRSIVIENAMHDRKLRRDRAEQEEWDQYAERLVEGKDGLRQLDTEIDFKESLGEDTLYLRQLRQQRKRELAAAEQYLDFKGAGLRQLENEQAKLNRRIYDFADLSRDAAPLRLLSPEYWNAAEKCHAAYTASEDIELEILELEQTQQAPRYEAFRQSADDVSKFLDGDVAEAAPSPESATEYGPAQLDDRLNALTDVSYAKSKLLKALKRAHKEQFQNEAILNRIAHDLLVQCKRLPEKPPRGTAAGADSVSIEGRRSTAENGTQEHRNVTGNPEERADGSNSPIGNHESAAQSGEDQAESPSRLVPGEQEMSREDRVERVRREAREESNRCRVHPNKPSPNGHAIAAIKSRVADAREQFVFAAFDFQEVRGRNLPDFITSLDREAQGPAFVEHVQQTARVMAEAEDERRNALHEAHIAGVIINEKCQSWNFCGCDDETFTIGRRPGPPTRLQISDVQQWLDGITGGEEEGLQTPPDWSLEANMDRDQLIEHEFGEEPSGDGLYHAYDIALDRKEWCIASLKDLQQNLRRGLEDREHRRNAPLVPGGLNPEPAEHDLYFDLVEDDHRFDVTWNGGAGRGPPRKISPPTPAEGDLHPMNRDPSISHDIDQPSCWGNINKPLFRWVEPQPSAPDEEAQKSPENGAGGNEDEPESNGSNNDQQYPNNSSSQALLHGPNAPLIDYAIEGYDGENMDGIE